MRTINIKRQVCFTLGIFLLTTMCTAWLLMAFKIYWDDSDAFTMQVDGQRVRFMRKATIDSPYDEIQNYYQWSVSF